MASINAAGFYGGNRLKSRIESKNQDCLWFHRKLRKIEESARHFKDRPLIPIKKDSIFSPHPIWEVFGTQSQALDYATHCKELIENRVFVISQELSDDGKRHFIVSSFEEFWRQYKKMPKSKRNFYEVIPEGHSCRLYFDLEFYKDVNPGLQGTDITEVFINMVCFFLQQIYDIQCNRGNIVDLDSSTAVKFSRHLIFHLPKAVFSSNIECGSFVKYVYEMARRKLAKNSDLDCSGLRPMDVNLEKVIEPPDGIDIEMVFVNNKDGRKAFFADLGVYTKNRNFRLYGSSKIGKNAHLVISTENGFHGLYKENRKPKHEHADSEFSMFLDTLVCYYGTKTSELKVLTFGNVSAVPGNFCCMGKKDVQEMHRIVEEGYRGSPYPKIDEFMLTQINKGGVKGTIRCWIHFVNSNMLLYDIDRNHFCENIGRAHKSNHIYFIVDMRHGTFYQKCHDPDCIDFKSEEKMLPEDVNTALNDSDFLIEELDDSSFGFLCDAAEVAECGELLADDQINDTSKIHDEKLCQKKENPITKYCNGSSEVEYLSSDPLMLESLNDDWCLELIEDNGEESAANQNNLSDDANDPNVVERNYELVSKVSDTDCLVFGQDSSDVVHGCRNAEVCRQIRSTDFQAERNSSLSNRTYDKSSCLSALSDFTEKVDMEDFEGIDSGHTMSHKHCVAKARNCMSGMPHMKQGTTESELLLKGDLSSWSCENSLQVEALPYKKEENGNENAIHSDESIHHDTNSKKTIKCLETGHLSDASYILDSSILDTSSVRCELSDFLLDSDFEDELVKLN